MLSAEAVDAIIKQVDEKDDREIQIEEYVQLMNGLEDIKNEHDQELKEKHTLEVKDNVRNQCGGYKARKEGKQYNDECFAIILNAHVESEKAHVDPLYNDHNEDVRANNTVVKTLHSYDLPLYSVPDVDFNLKIVDFGNSAVTIEAELKRSLQDLSIKSKKFIIMQI